MMQVLYILYVHSDKLHMFAGTTLLCRLLTAGSRHTLKDTPAAHHVFQLGHVSLKIIMVFLHGADIMGIHLLEHQSVSSALRHAALWASAQSDAHCLYTFSLEPMKLKLGSGRPIARKQAELLTSCGFLNQLKDVASFS